MTCSGSAGAKTTPAMWPSNQGRRQAAKVGRLGVSATAAPRQALNRRTVLLDEPTVSMSRPSRTSRPWTSAAVVIYMIAGSWIASRPIRLRGRSNVTWFEGNYQEYGRPPKAWANAARAHRVQEADAARHLQIRDFVERLVGAVDLVGIEHRGHHAHGAEAPAAGGLGADVHGGALQGGLHDLSHLIFQRFSRLSHHTEGEGGGEFNELV